MSISPKIISQIGVKEKYIRKLHYNTLKVWWARRPIMAMRAVIINEILKQNPECQNSIDPSLIYELNPPKYIFKKFAEAFNTKNIAVLDVFSGGGSIPFEASRLGCTTYSSELNPIASLLQRTIFKSLPIEDYAQKLEEAGKSVIDRTAGQLKDIFILDNIVPYVIFWGKVAKCKTCQEKLPLTRLKYLAKKKNKVITIEKEQETFFLNFSSIESKKRAKTKGFICPNCSSENTFADIKKYCENHVLDKEPIALCYHDRQGKKQYKAIDTDLRNKILDIEQLVHQRLETLVEFIPDEAVTTKSGVVNPTLYDLKKHKDFFNNRQLLVLLTLIAEIKKEWLNLQEKENTETAQQIILGLTCLLEFLIDWNSVSTMWIAQNEQTGRSLAGPGVGMKWDYIEVNPFYNKGSNLYSKLERVVQTFAHLSIQNDVSIINGSSANLPLSDNSIDLVVTDPPYFDSIDYTALSEFFRPWFEVVLKNTFHSNVSLKNDISKEAIVDLAKTSGRKKKNSAHYKNIMTAVLKEVVRVLKPKGICSLLYSHKTIEGWQVIAEAFKTSGLFIDSCIAVEMERIARPRAMSYQALNGVVIFRLKKQNLDIENVESELNNIPTLLKNKQLEESSIPIYLAALACKQYGLMDKDFMSCYEKVISHYERIKNASIDLNKIDSLVKTYSKAYNIENAQQLSDTELTLLKENGLWNENHLMSLSALSIEAKKLNGKSKIIHELAKLYTEYQNNSTTKIKLNQQLRDNALLLYSTIGGVNLNTVRHRSSSEEKKVARLILAKIH